MSEGPTVDDPARGLGRVPPSRRALVLIVHPDAASLRQPGHEFVADVLHANGYATRHLCLHEPAEQAAGLPPPGMVQTKARLRAWFEGLARHPDLGGVPLALIGLGGAAAGCIGAAARGGLPGLQSLVLLDAPTELVPHHLRRLSLPTLFVLGRCGARRLARHRLATRDMPAGSRLEVLGLATLPVPQPGALQALACAALDWFDKSLAGVHAPGAGRTRQEPADQGLARCGGAAPLPQP